MRYVYENCKYLRMYTKGMYILYTNNFYHSKIIITKPCLTCRSEDSGYYAREGRGGK